MREGLHLDVMEESGKEEVFLDTVLLKGLFNDGFDLVDPGFALFFIFFTELFPIISWADMNSYSSGCFMSTKPGTMDS